LRDPDKDYLERAPGGLDRPPVASATFVYQLPFGKGRTWDNGNKVVSTLISGWQQGTELENRGFDSRDGQEDMDLAPAQSSPSTRLPASSSWEPALCAVVVVCAVSIVADRNAHSLTSNRFNSAPPKNPGA
jgi:hypothetical protein